MNRINPKFPLFIPSKGRAEYMITSNALDSIGVPHRLVIEPQEYKVYLDAVNGKKNKFPNLFFTPDHNEKAQFYSGLIHCIPNKNSLRAKEVIYSIDARSTKNCECSSIVPMVKSEPYDCNKNYSDYYKAQLCDKDYSKTQLEEPKIAEPKIAEPKIAEPKIPINKCGPILLSEALVLIQRHNIKYYGPNCAIKIYISSCLGEGDLVNARKHYRSSFLTRWHKKKEHEPTLSIKQKHSVIYNDGYEGEKQREPLVIDGNYFTTEDEVSSLAESLANAVTCLLYTSPSPRDRQKSRMPSSA